MTNFLQKRDPWGQGMALWVLLGMVFLVPLAWWSVKQIQLENDVESWLPSDDPHARTFAWYRREFPVENRVIVTWNLSSLNDPRVKRFARKLEGVPGKDGIRRGGIPYVKRVITAQQVIARIEKASRGRVKRDEAIKRLEGVLIGTGNLKVTLTNAGRQRRKRVEQDLLARIRDVTGLDVRIVAAQKIEFDFLAEEEEDNFEESFEEEEGEEEEEFPLPPEHDFQLVWEGLRVSSPDADRVKSVALNLRGPVSDKNPQGEKWIQRCAFFPGSPVALLIVLSEAGQEESRQAFAAIRKAAVEAGIPETDLHLGGRSVAGSALNQQVKKAVWNSEAGLFELHKRSPILLSVLVCVVLAFVMLKSIRLAIMVLAVSYYTTYLTVALLPVTSGSMNMVVVVMPTLLSVLTMSAAIHVVNYWKHAAATDMRSAVIESLKMAKLPCLLASLTTAIGLMSLMTSPLMPVRDFGLYSAVGCLIGLAAVLFGLPALLMFWPPKQPKQADVEHTFWKSLGKFLCRYRTTVALISLGLFAGSAYGLRFFRTETKVIRYFPDDSRVVKDYRFLEDNLSGIVPVDVVIRFEKTDARFDENGKPIPHFLERMEIVRRIERAISRHPDISGTLSLADFQGQYRKLPKNAKLAQTMRDFGKSRVTENRIKKDATAQSFLVAARTDEKLVSPSGRVIAIKKGDELWKITAQVAILSDLDYADLTHEVDEIVRSELKLYPGSDHVVTGMVPLFLRTQQAVLDSLIRSFALAFAVIAVVMMIVLKNPIAGLITMLPNVMPVGVVFGLISWSGMPVDIGTMITASVALGIAVDGTLHLLTWFRSGIEQGLSRNEAVSRALTHCGPAMWQTSAAVGIGLLMLFPADLLLIHRFGWLMASLIGAAFLADVIFLPALLAGPLGFVIERSMRNETSLTNPDEPTDPPSKRPPGPPHLLKIHEKDGKILRIDKPQ
ncbi:MAG: MMPL family transporter [Planctomycetes bacterium]|nr:MMPL family transporter [Planctomycetota bacterium]